MTENVEIAPTAEHKALLEDVVRTRNIVERLLACAGSAESRPGTWSLEEVALHLVLTFEHVADGFEAVLRERPMEAPEIDWKRALARRVVLSTFRIPGGRPSPEAVAPGAIIPVSEISERLDSGWRRLVRLNYLLAEEPRETCWVEHPSVGALSYREWVRFMLIHALHHERIEKKRGRLDAAIESG